ELKLPGVRLSPLERQAVTAKFDLTLTLLENEAGITGALEYNTDLFDRTTVSRLAGHFVTLLSNVVALLDRGISQLPLLSAAEQWQLVGEWNDTWRTDPQATAIQQLFEAQAGRTPEAIAVEFAGEQVSYAELDRRAQRLAHHLRGRDVGTDVLVGMFVERSVEMVVGILGVLKAGGAYLPLDPDHPQERLAFMLEDARVPLLLIQERMRDRLPAHAAEIVDVGRLPAGGTAIAPPAVSSEQLAYLLYTSGTTGRPKGVAVPHGTVIQFLESMRREPGLSSRDRLLAVTTLSFDIAVLELLLPLTAGARVVVADREQAADGAQLKALLADRGITVLQGTPATWRLLLEAGWPGNEGACGLRILCGGEALPRELAERLLARSPAVWNLYGPTETTVWSAVHRLESAAAPVPIGRPIGRTGIFLLDAHLRPVPAGVAGELHIGGAGLVRGYFGRPRLTAERFIPNPFNATGERLYTTGDLARCLPDGTIEFLGRRDHQVKLRGFRIELEEIAAVLAEHPGIRQAVVVLRQERLVAYAVAGGDSPPKAGELRSFLKERLPEYMVPAAYVELEALPLTPNRKVDRKALPEPQAGATAESYVMPRDPVEEILAGIWAQVLGLDRVGIRDHFFELGGHSMLATQVLSRVREAFRVELPLRRLFEGPTVAELAERVRAIRAREEGPEAAAIRPVPRDRELPLSFAQERLWFLDQLEPAVAAYNLRAVVRLSGRLEIAALATSLGEVVRRHESLRTRFVAHRGEPVQRLEPPPEAVALPLVDLSALEGDRWQAEARRLNTAEARRPFDLGRDPLLRAIVVRTDDATHLAFLTMHHIVSDAWSMRVLVREIGHLYGTLVRDRPPELPELPIQYADYALWQRERLHGERLERELAYWRQQLGESPAVLDLPTDRPVPKVTSPRGGAVRRSFPTGLLRALRARSRESGATLFMALLAGFQALLHRESGQREVSVGTPIAGRTRAELEDLIGFFVNTLVLRSAPAPGERFAAHLAAVRERCLGAYAHQEVPFERLVAELVPERSLSHTPLFQAMLMVEEDSPGELEWPGLRLNLAFDVAGGGGAQLGRLTLSMFVQEESLNADLAFQRDLFDPTTMSRLLAHFETLLEAAVDDPERRVDELPLLAAAERHQVRWECNDTQAPFPWEDGVHHAIERQAAERPDAIALIGNERWLSYGELDRRSDRLAHRLRDQGVGPEGVVALCVERSPEMVIALLAILKAGGAYLPLSPTAPRERLSFQIEDAGAVALVATRDAADHLDVPFPPTWVGAPSPLGDTSGSFPNHPPRGEGWGEGFFSLPEQASYVIYTSGSTGRPKGVQVTHRSMANIVTSFIASYGLSAADRVLQQTTVTFDVA
ncbi:MAG: amino acid adenylation domain-containing protein, partial [bacterium]|nr:amino acid adenylation domain-containing protein [bacterium]